MNNLSPSRTLSAFDGICLVVGLIVGVGIYQTPPGIASSVPSELALYGMWLVGAFLTYCGALCYVELATAYPKVGGDYFFIQKAYGRGAGFLYGWSNVLLLRPGAIATIAYPFAAYFSSIAGTTDIEAYKVALIPVLVLTVFNVLGTTLGRIAQNILSIISYSLLLCLTIGGIYYGTETHSFSLRASQSGEANYQLALILVLFCYGGWSELALMAGEIKKPATDFLKIMLTGITLVCFIYCALHYAYISALGLDGLRNSSAPAASLLPSSGKTIVAGLVCLCCLSSLNALILAGSRVSCAFGKDHSFFSLLGGWDQKRNTPLQALLLQCVLSCGIIVAAGSFEAALVYTTTVVWSFYFFVGLSVIVLRKKDSETERPFLTPLYPLPVLFFAASCLLLIYSAFLYDYRGSVITIAFALLGVPVYLTQEFMKKKSKKNST